MALGKGRGGHRALVHESCTSFSHRCRGAEAPLAPRPFLAVPGTRSFSPLPSAEVSGPARRRSGPRRAGDARGTLWLERPAGRGCRAWAWAESFQRIRRAWCQPMVLALPTWPRGPGPMVLAPRLLLSLTVLSQAGPAGRFFFVSPYPVAQLVQKNTARLRCNSWKNSGTK